MVALAAAAAAVATAAAAVATAEPTAWRAERATASIACGTTLARAHSTAASTTATVIPSDRAGGHSAPPTPTAAGATAAKPAAADRSAAGDAPLSAAAALHGDGGDVSIPRAVHPARVLRVARTYLWNSRYKSYHRIPWLERRLLSHQHTRHVYERDFVHAHAGQPVPDLH